MRNRVALLVLGSVLSIGSPAALGCSSEPPEEVGRDVAALEPSLPAYGVMYADGWLGSSSLHLAGESGLAYARANFVYDATRQYADPITDFDWVVENAAAAGVTVLPVLIKADSGGPARLDLLSQPERGGWERFSSLLAMRYGPGGSFWSEHEGIVSYRPILAWEIWNEPNLEAFGDLSPNAFRITLRIARRGLRAGDPNARIVLGGLSFSGGAMEYLKRVAATKSSRCLFDAVAIHPYSATPEGALELIEKTVHTLRDLGLQGRGAGKDVDLWITEIGWAVANPDWPLCEKVVDGECKQRAPYTVPDAETQADYMEKFARGLEERRAAWRIGPTIWYAYSDLPPTTGDPEQTWWRHCGLLGLDAAGQPIVPRPSFWRAGEIAAAKPTVGLPPLRCP